MKKQKWFRVVSQNGVIWIDGVKKKNWPFKDIVPSTANGFVVITDDGPQFIPDEKKLVDDWLKEQGY